MSQTLVEGALPSGEPIRERVTVNSVRVNRPRHALEGAFRDIEADIEGATDGVDSVIGKISGCVTWLAWLPELLDDCRMIDSFAELIPAAMEIGDLLSTRHGSKIVAVLMIDRVWLEPHWRGYRLGRRIAEQLIDLLLLTPESTVVLAYLEPEVQEPGHEAAFRADGVPGPAPHDGDGRTDFEQWRSSKTWWLRPRNAGLHS